MRLMFLPLAATGLLSATPAPEPAPTALAMDPSTCDDRIRQVRDAAGQPRLDRSPAVPGEGLLIAAVDKRIDGCAVMQMHRRIDDLRPIPNPSTRPARLIPLRGQ